jgi:hypothetical protein
MEFICIEYAQFSHFVQKTEMLQQIFLIKTVVIDKYKIYVNLRYGINIKVNK